MSQASETRKDEPVSGLEAVLLANRDRLLRFLRSRGAGEDAEDLLQELWIKVGGAPGGPIAEPVSYLFRAANNLLLDRRRAAMRSAARDTGWSELASGPDAQPPDGERMLIARERLARTEAVLDALGERTALIFRQFRVDGVSQRQIAVNLGLSLSAVEKHLQKAYRALIEFRETGDAE